MRSAAARAAPAHPPRYQRHQPEQTALYRLVQQHLQTFLAQAEAAGTDLPRFVTEEFDAYLECGILAQRAATNEMHGSESFTATRGKYQHSAGINLGSRVIPRM